MKSKVIWIIVIVVIILGGWFIFSRPSRATPTTTTPSTATGVKGGTDQSNPIKDLGGPLPGTVPVFRVATSSTLGVYLTAANGMTLYTYSHDIANYSSCTDTCAQAWPPYIPASNVSYALQFGITGKISTIIRTDGLKQVTYNGQPLYYYVKDTVPGDVTGQAVGGVWFVKKP